MKTLSKLITALTLSVLLFSAGSVAAQAVLPRPNSLSGLSAEQQKAFINEGVNKSGGGYGVAVVIPFITYFSVGFTAAVGLLGMVYGGVLYVATFGDETQVGKAKKIIMWGLIGLVVGMFSYAFVAVILKIKIQ